MSEIAWEPWQFPNIPLYKTKLSDDISAEVTFDVGNNTGGTAYTAFLKKAYMKW